MSNETIRELFIEELAEVKGGSGPLDKVLQKLGLGDSTMACCEEGQCCDYLTVIDP